MAKKNLIFKLFYLCLENISVITLSDLKEIVKDPDNLLERIKKINVLKEKIDKILEDGHYDCDDIFLITIMLIQHLLNV